MKQTVSLFMTLLLALTVTMGFAQNAKSPHITAESPDKNIKIEYGQPSMRGRVLFAQEGVTSLEKYGKPWRTGADAATEITFKNDVMFGGKMVKAGKYTLVTIPNEKEWSVILNTVLGQWGAYDYDKHVDKNILEVKAPVVTNKTPVEKLTITPTNKSLSIAWGATTITVPVMNHGMN
ncbi:DUF2911 domain-containing protein [Fibrella arboris]|uniref:DUF2911 domain-containing protein n=1 Tax=Fibrella arboris TaxID=3242486 RepID=UPI0035217F03